MGNFFPEGMPLPVGDLITKPFWDAVKQHELRIQRCTRCGYYRHAPQPTCYNCQSFDYEWVKSRGVGEVFTYGIVHSPNHPAVREMVPFNIVVVQLEDCGQVRLTSNMINCKNEDIHVGMKVQVAWEDTTPEISQFRWEPLKQ